MSPPVLAFDIETVPDAEGLRAVYGFPADLPDTDVIDMAARLRRQEKNTDFMPLPLQRIAVISCVLEKSDTLYVLSLNAWEDEKNAVQRFFDGMEKLDKECGRPPRLVSWNGGGFDLPVLNYRALKHGVSAPLYWENGDARSDFRFNRTYGNRYNNERHLDLMDSMAMFQFGATAKLDDVAKLCGLPGKLGMAGNAVSQAFAEGKTDDIRRYCEGDAMLTYLLYLRFEQFCGKLNDEQRIIKEQNVRDYMKNAGEEWQEFLDGWADSH